MKKRADIQNEQLSAEANLLDIYLNQYRHCISRKKSLEHRRSEIYKEFNDPLNSSGMDGMPHGSSTGVGCAALSYRLDEINTRIEEQTREATEVLVNIMSILDFLPGDSKERAILEYKYIDRFGWERIAREVSISRSPAIRAWKKGLYSLLKFKKVKKILREYEDQKNDCEVM